MADDETPPKTNIDPKNWWFVDVSPFPRRYFLIPAVSFSGEYFVVQNICFFCLFFSGAKA